MSENLAAILKGEIGPPTAESVARILSYLPAFRLDDARSLKEWIGSTRVTPDAGSSVAAHDYCLWLEAQFLWEDKQYARAQSAFSRLSSGGIGDWCENKNFETRCLMEQGRYGDAFTALSESLREFPSYRSMDKGSRLLRRILKHYRPPAKRILRIAVLGSSTTALLAPLIELLCYRDGIEPQIYEGSHGQYRQEILDPGSGLARFAPEIVILSTSYRDAGIEEYTENRPSVEELLKGLRSTWEQCVSRFACHVIQNNFDVPALSPYGELSQRLPECRDGVLRELNLRMVREAPASVSILDFDQVSGEYSKERWHDPSIWAVAKQHPAVDALPMLAERYLAHVRAVTGLARKCLVLDLDDTVWGGVAGEDGWMQLKIGAGDPAGESYLAFQQYCSWLGRRGILLAACTKNNPEDALAPFENRVEMVLKRSDFAAFVANWQPKAANLRQIASTLNLSPDALVFVDDNPVERAAVRREMPDVAVPELPREPALRIASLHRHHYFPAISLSAEDTQRTVAYAQSVNPTERGQTESLEGFLAGLEMAAEMGPFDEENLPRIAQLINKTNQFNLTTRRYTLEQVRSVASSPAFLAVWARLRDRYGDHGLVAVFIGRLAGETLEVDTWLMSCRVMGRALEDEVLFQVAALAKSRGLRQIKGLFLPSRKNAPVQDLYGQLGFRLLKKSETGESEWVLPLDGEVKSRGLIRTRWKTEVHERAH